MSTEIYTPTLGRLVVLLLGWPLSYGLCDTRWEGSTTKTRGSDHRSSGREHRWPTYSSFAYPTNSPSRYSTTESPSSPTFHSLSLGLGPPESRSQSSPVLQSGDPFSILPSGEDEEFRGGLSFLFRGGWGGSSRWEVSCPVYLSVGTVVPTEVTVVYLIRRHYPIHNWT